MSYYENTSNGHNKFWKITDLSDILVEVHYGPIGKLGIKKTFNFDNIDEKNIFLNKKIEEKEKKGYIKVGKKEKTIVKQNNLISYPNPKLFKKTQTGYVYYDIDSNITCRFTGNEPSPKGLGLCARMVNEGFEIKGKDGTNWIKKGSKWVRKENKVKQPKAKTKKVSIQTKVCPEGKVLNPSTGRCIKDKSVQKSQPKAKTKKVVAKRDCPPGKVLNPTTGRCIIDKSVQKSQSKTKKVSHKIQNVVTKISKGKMLYDVKKNGVMLAHTFKNNQSGKIRSAPKNTSQAPNGWYASEKFDGYRAVWDGQNFRSRNGLIFEAPQYFKDWMPNNYVLDGELFIGRECFEKCGIFRRKIPDENEWKKLDVKYNIFDCITDKIFEDRYKLIQSIIKTACSKMKGKCPLILVKQTKIKDENQLNKIFNNLVSKGAEGVMLRAPNSPYESKRSSYLLKVKQLYDDECRIIGYKNGTGKYASMLGAFECELVKNKNIKFSISGMDDSIRSSYKKTHPLGTIITFTYVGLSNKGVPRHPNYLRIRNKKY